MLGTASLAIEASLAGVRAAPPYLELEECYPIAQFELDRENRFGFRGVSEHGKRGGIAVRNGKVVALATHAARFLHSTPATSAAAPIKPRHDGEEQ